MTNELGCFVSEVTQQLQKKFEKDKSVYVVMDFYDPEHCNYSIRIGCVIHDVKYVLLVHITRHDLNKEKPKMYANRWVHMIKDAIEFLQLTEEEE